MSNPTLEFSAIFFSKILLYNDKVVIKRFFGVNTTTIPANKIAGVTKSLTKGIVIETSGGNNHEVSLWNRSKDNQVIDEILRISKNA